MSEQSDDARIENVAPGDIISLELPDRRGGDSREYKVVHKDSGNSGANPMIIVTLEGDDGETFDVELPADSVVHRTLESKWESEQSPTPHDGG
ncbi:MAG: hypothetical protein WBB00_26185 [Mycobacterium sp.]